MLSEPRLWIPALKSWLVHITQLAETRMYRLGLECESTLNNVYAGREWVLQPHVLCGCSSLLMSLLFSCHWTSESMSLCIQQSAVEGTVGGPPRAFYISQLLWGMASQAHSCLPFQRITLDLWKLFSQRDYRSVSQHTHTHTHAPCSPLTPANSLVLLLQIGTTL